METVTVVDFFKLFLTLHYTTLQPFLDGIMDFEKSEKIFPTNRL